MATVMYSQNRRIIQMDLRQVETTARVSGLPYWIRGIVHALGYPLCLVGLANMHRTSRSFLMDSDHTTSGSKTSQHARTW